MASDFGSWELRKKGVQLFFGDGSLCASNG
jgi:hypothetical protein